MRTGMETSKYCLARQTDIVKSSSEEKSIEEINENKCIYGKRKTESENFEEILRSMVRTWVSASDVEEKNMRDVGGLERQCVGR